MPQRIVHYAVANELAKRVRIKDRYRFVLGSIIPDANLHTDEDYERTHYIIILGDEREYDYKRFLRDYKNEIQKDDIYLGYYIHLATDSLGKTFSRDVMHIREHKDEEGFREKLYEDYHNLNPVLIKRYGLSRMKICVSEVPKCFGLNTIDKIQEELDADFDDICKSNLNYLKEECIIEFIENTVDTLKIEIEKILKD